MKRRDYTLDILKVIALLCIILAHTNPNKIVFQIRNFDVPLMIMISVWLSINTISKNKFNYSMYIRKRINRLLMPTWIFISIYILINYIMGEVPTIKTIISSYLLIDGIGYVWVIRIYIYIAIVTPILYRLYSKINVYVWISGGVFTYFVYELLILFIGNYNGELNQILTSLILDFIGYSLVVFVSISLYKASEKKVLFINFICLILFIMLAIKNNFALTQAYKYPIRLYYVSYAFFVSISIYFIVKKVNEIKRIKENKIIIFISNNSMWIYLWHILFLDFTNKLFIGLKYGFILRLIILIILSCCMSLIQNTLIKTYKNLRGVRESQN